MVTTPATPPGPPSFDFAVMAAEEAALIKEVLRVHPSALRAMAAKPKFKMSHPFKSRGARRQFDRSEAVRNALERTVGGTPQTKAMQQWLSEAEAHFRASVTTARHVLETANAAGSITNANYNHYMGQYHEAMEKARGAYLKERNDIFDAAERAAKVRRSSWARSSGKTPMRKWFYWRK